MFQSSPAFSLAVRSSNDTKGRRQEKRERNRKRGLAPKRSSRRSLPPRFFILALGLLIVIAIAATAYFAFYGPGHVVTTTVANTSVPSVPGKWKILYVNQGNGAVDGTNFGNMLSIARSHGFNTVFFQVYRSGALLFTTQELKSFVISSHVGNTSIFFALYFTDSNQQIPNQIYGLGEDGISLDMSTLSTQRQEILFSNLKQSYAQGKIAITSTNFTTTLRPDLLVLETYIYASDKQYVRAGIIAGIEPLNTQNKQDYETQFNYALGHSDGVMVFDYYGLVTKGY